MKITKKDLIIISELRKNDRESLTRLSRKTRIPVSTIYDRLKFQEKSIIKKHCALIDFSKIGFPTKTTILLKVPISKRKELLEHVSKNLNVNNVFKVNNDYDVLIEAIFRDMREAERFVERLEERFSIIDKKVFYVIEELKRESFLANPTLLDLIIGK